MVSRRLQAAQLGTGTVHTRPPHCRPTSPHGVRPIWHGKRASVDVRDSSTPMRTTPIRVYDVRTRFTHRRLTLN